MTRTLLAFSSWATDAPGSRYCSDTYVAGKSRNAWDMLHSGLVECCPGYANQGQILAVLVRLPKLTHQYGIRLKRYEGCLHSRTVRSEISAEGCVACDGIDRAQILRQVFAIRIERGRWERFSATREPGASRWRRYNAEPVPLRDRSGVPHEIVARGRGNDFRSEGSCPRDRHHPIQGGQNSRVMSRQPRQAAPIPFQMPRAASTRGRLSGQESCYYSAGRVRQLASHDEKLPATHRLPRRLQRHAIPRGEFCRGYSRFAPLLLMVWALHQAREPRRKRPRSSRCVGA